MKSLSSDHIKEEELNFFRALAGQGLPRRPGEYRSRNQSFAASSLLSSLPAPFFPS
jgi:hypothetical protein